MILDLRTAIYPAPDLAAARDWYAEALGIAPHFDQPFYVGFSVGGFELGLAPDATPGTNGPQPLWGVDNIDTVFDPITEVGQGIRVAAVIDPFGNRFGVIENPHFNAAAVR